MRTDIRSTTDRIVFNSIPFRRYVESPRPELRNYYVASDGKGTRLHRAIWEHHHGPIPEGHHVHHRDGNPLNNDIGNLECLPREQHLSGHWTPEKRERAARRMDEIRPLTVDWHRSEEGRAWHREHGREAYAKRESVERKCDQCGAAFNSMSLREDDRFCSNKCKSAWRRASGLDDVERSCAICGAGFVCNKYSKTVACSRSCGMRYAHRQRRAGV